MKSHGKRTVQDIAIEKAALSPWGKEDDYNTKQLSAGKITKSVAKRKPRPKSATSLRNNTQNFRDKDFGVIGSGINGTCKILEERERRKKSHIHKKFIWERLDIKFI